MNLGNFELTTEYGTIGELYHPPVKINKIHEDAHLPTYGSKCAACADLYAYITSDEASIQDKDGKPCIWVNPGETVKVNTGLRMAPPEGWYVAIYARSGLATKQGLAPANCVGVVDQDYRGPVIVALHNHSNMPQMITHGDRIAQMAVVPYWQGRFEEVAALDDTERGAGGFGSTGVQ